MSGPAPSDAPRVRALALGAVALVVTAAGAVVGDAREPTLVVVSLVLAGVSAWRWRAAGRTGVSTSAAVAAALVGLLLLERLLDDPDTLLLVTALLALALGWTLRERRLAVSGLLSLALLLGQPVAGGATFSHCLLAPSVALPTPRLDGPLLLAAGAVVVGTLLRWTGWGGRPTVARGIEATGAIGLAVLLAAKGMELPGHRLLCGSGEAIDEGWVLLGVGVGVLAGLYGLASRDVVWEGVGLASITGQGVLATGLTGDPWWAVGCGVLLVGSLAVAEWLGVAWPDEPGYAVARPRPADLRGRARRHTPDRTDAPSPPEESP